MPSPRVAPTATTTRRWGSPPRGAWESVKRHFRGLGVNTQEDEFSVVGIGDMGGDVFGNGMLLSDKIRLVGAFNHLHIFVDPEPDAAATFAERKRLFEMPRSSWEDFDSALISEGGGVFKRSAKSIPISKQMKARFGIREDRLSPNELISAMLKSEVDLIWNGGIGTYVKGSDETDAQVGDKANDGLRIDGRELNCKVVGEGGNLGFTQRGRMEAAARGVRVNTDFIDNAGGVNCSDHEVNIKILIDEVVKRGDMTDKQRNQLLAEMTGEVSDLVLLDNYRQTQALDLAELLSQQGVGPFRRFISELEAAGQLDRELEFLPVDEELQERAANQQGMLLPELAMLISYAKSVLKGDLIVSDVPDDPVIVRYVERIFPRVLVERYRDEMYEHRLKREIVATQVANDLVDHMGIVFVRRLIDSTGAGRAEIARAYIIAREVFGLSEALVADRGAGQPGAEPRAVLDDARPDADDPPCHALVPARSRRPRYPRVHRLLRPAPGGDPQGIGERLQRRGARPGRPAVVTSWWKPGARGPGGQRGGRRSLYAGLGIIQAARQADVAPEQVAEVFYEIGSRLELPWMIRQITDLQVRDSWQAQARETFRDDIDRQQLALTVSVLQMEAGPDDAVAGVAEWLERHDAMHARWRRLLRAGGQRRPGVASRSSPWRFASWSTWPSSRDL